MLIHGRHVFMGYQGLPELTRDVFTQDGFLRSGDIGYLNDVRLAILSGKGSVHKDAQMKSCLVKDHCTKMLN